ARGHIAQAHRIERVQRLLRTLGVPPAVGELGELVEFGLAEVLRALGRGGHGDVLWMIGGVRDGAAQPAPVRMPAMRVRHWRALATTAVVSMSTSSRSRSFAAPPIQTSETWWRPAA